MNRQKWRPEPSTRDQCRNCGHERVDHAGKKGVGRCLLCAAGAARLSDEHCLRFRKYERRRAS